MKKMPFYFFLCAHFFTTLLVAQKINPKFYSKLYIADSLLDERKYGEASKIYKRLHFSNKLIDYSDYLNRSHCYAMNKDKKGALLELKKALKIGYKIPSTIQSQRDSAIYAIAILFSLDEKYFVSSNQLFSKQNMFSAESDSLVKLKLLDQKYRVVGKTNDTLWKLQLKIDSLSSLYLNSLLTKMNWPGIRQVGFEGSKAAFLIVQHSHDINFQKKCLDRMKKEVLKRNIYLPDIAYLYDRIQINLGKHQIFGTQIEYHYENGVEKARPKKLKYPKRVTALRYCFEMVPLERYLYDMNKQLNNK